MGWLCYMIDEGDYLGISGSVPVLGLYVRNSLVCLVIDTTNHSGGCVAGRSVRAGTSGLLCVFTLVCRRRRLAPCSLEL